jgi:hypothetical protein
MNSTIINYFITFLYDYDFKQFLKYFQYICKKFGHPHKID